ncbi:putative Demethylmenaquinone methyltransferase [Rhexocercosporidium sp. MPI-PUGE-AT-0058]|nr:putative Demethylmenaquinone methyltransferase [Rhexocercosporidium sp. MPI-PUGE-AT-0058]
MAQLDREQAHHHTFSNHSSPTREAEPPLVLDDNHIDIDVDDDEDADEDLAEELIRFQARAARTLFHQPRSESDTLNSTQSLYDTDIEYLTIHERRYCENYSMPNDDAEQGRMQMLHDVYLDIFGGRLSLAPLQNPQKILDIGTGTGEWAIAMAELYPKADVIGTDIAKIQPTSVPCNVDFQIDDAEYVGGWTWTSNSFDLVHFRTMIGAFEDWNHIYREAYKTIKPGGYIEVVDLEIAAFPTYFPDNPMVVRWFNTFLEATKIAGRPMTTDHLEPEVLASAGFTNISATTKSIPCGVWPSENQERKMGLHFMSVIYDGIEAVSLRLFVEQLGWEPEDVTKLCKEVAKPIRALAHNPQRCQGYCMDVRVVVGRKPGGNELEVPDDKSTMGDSMRTVTNGDSSRGA